MSDLTKRPDMRRVPVCTLGELFQLNPAEIEEGYKDGLDGLPCGDNRSRAYWHGWRNAMVDRGHAEKDAYQAVLAHEVVRSGIASIYNHHVAVYNMWREFGLVE